MASETEEEGAARPTLPELEEKRSTLPDLDADPVVEEAPEDADPEHEPAEAAPRKKTRSWVYVLLGVLFFASVTGPFVFYVFVWRYRATTLVHLPPGATAAVRFEGREFYVFEPFREHVLSVFEASEAVGSRADRLRKHTGIDVRTDVREVIVATVTGDSVVVLLGGKFERTRLNQKGFVPALNDFFVEEGVVGFALEDDVLVGHGVRIGQAEDATIVIATSDDLLRAALEPNESWTDLGLSSSGAFSFVVDRPALAGAQRLPGGGAAAFTHTSRITGHLEFRREPRLLVEAMPRHGTDPETLAREIEAGIADARLMTLLLPDLIGEKQALANASVKPRAASVMITTVWPREGLERGCEALGASLRQLFPPK